jgi:Flp pilus assembly protein TadG
MKHFTQRGLSTVEFALVANVVLILMFAVFEVGRAYFVYAMLDEVTRRGVRVAVVCPINDPAIGQMAIFNTSGNSAPSSIVSGLTPGHITVEYLDQNNAVVGNPADTAGFIQIRYVRVRVVGYKHQMQVPIVSGITNFFMPEFSAVLPRESLGIPREGTITPC